jgi:hypothetical protein
MRKRQWGFYRWQEGVGLNRELGTPQVKRPRMS